MIKFFLYGTFAAIGALFFQLLVYQFAPSLIKAALNDVGMMAILIIFFALVEEIARLTAVRHTVNPVYALGKISSRRICFYAASVGAGFVAVEAALIALSFYDRNPFSFAAFAGSAVIHVATSVIIAATLIALRTWPRALRVHVALIIVTLLHAGYNLLALAGYTALGTVQAIFLGVLILATVLSCVLNTRTKRFEKE